ncbi:MAG: LysE family translocator [Rhodospirillales bacterium]
MALEIWLAFVVASTIMLVIPGPTVMTVVAYGLGNGARTALATVPGVVLGDAVAMTLSLAGAGALLAASAELFTALKVAGALYLIWLGIGLWRKVPKGTLEEPGAKRETARAMFLNCFVVTALNPKSIVFFVAFVPQFMTAEAPFWEQAMILIPTFLVLAGLNNALWSLAAGSMRAGFSKPSARKLINRLGGGFLIGAGLLTLAAKRG